MAQNSGHFSASGSASKLGTSASRPTVAQRLLEMNDLQLHKENPQFKVPSPSAKPQEMKPPSPLNTQKAGNNPEPFTVVVVKEAKTEQGMEFQENCGATCAATAGKYVPPHRSPANFWSHPNYEVSGGFNVTYPFTASPRRRNTGWTKCPKGTIIPSDVDGNWRRN